MSTLSLNPITQLSKDQLENLVTIVPETLALDHKLPAAKIYTTAELWNLQRNKTQVAKRRIVF